MIKATNYFKELQDLSRAFSTLTPKERKIMNYRWGFEDGKNHTLEESAKKNKISKERARQLEAQSFSKFRIVFAALRND